MARSLQSRLLHRAAVLKMKEGFRIFHAQLRSVNELKDEEHMLFTLQMAKRLRLRTALKASITQ